jgi:phosphoglycerate dehydrogenase-like enzyme
MKILIPDAQFDDQPEVELSQLPDAEFLVHRALTPADIPDDVWAACDGILLWHIIDITPEVVGKLANCKHIVRLGIGYDRINLKACGEAGIPVSNVPTYDMTDVVNSTIGMVLTLMRGFLSYHEALKKNIVEGWAWDGPPALRRVRGQRFGVIGCGRIGTAVLTRAKALGMEVGYYDPYLPVGHEMSLDFNRFETLSDLLGWADATSIHTPLNDETTDMINAKTVAMMKPGMIVANCARGKLVDLDAIEGGIRSGNIAGAALDAFALEPPPPHPLLTAWANDEDWVKGRLCLTPHSSWYSTATFDDIRRDAARTQADYLLRGNLRNQVNAEFMSKNK